MGVEITKWNKFEKGTLQGFFTARLTNIGLEMRDCTLHQKDVDRWIGLPAKPYEKDGKTAYSYIVKFYEKEKWSQFQRATIKALDEYLVAKGEQPAEGDISF